MKKHNLLLSVILGVVLFGACSKEDVAGTATQTENTIAGVVVRSDGTPAANSIVRMASVASKDLKSGAIEYWSRETDAHGNFVFKGVISDSFQLAVLDTHSSEILYLPEVVAGSWETDSLKLEPAAIFKGALVVTEHEVASVDLGSHFAVGIVGLPIFESVFVPDEFAMMIPPGTWEFQFYPGDPQIVKKLQEQGVPDSEIFRKWKMTEPVESGDTVYVGAFVWGTEVDVDDIIKQEEKPVRISGKVLCNDGTPCSDVEVSLVTDIYGFGFTKGLTAQFTSQTRTDGGGRWYLVPPPEVPFDSFRVEYHFKSATGDEWESVSRYVQKEELDGLEDTLSIGTSKLELASALDVDVLLTLASGDQTQDPSDCLMNSVVVGVKGTSRFVRGLSCSPLQLTTLPAGNQEILHYSGDADVIKLLLEGKYPIPYYVNSTNVELPKGQVMGQLWLTYTPPYTPPSTK